jgi:bud emergence protein 1
VLCLPERLHLKLTAKQQQQQQQQQVQTPGYDSDSDQQFPSEDGLFPLNLDIRLNQGPLVACTNAAVQTFEYLEGRHCFVIYATFADGSEWELLRIYDNFYKLQRKLLQRFPVEAGSRNEKRTLPYMPGPLADGIELTEEITEGRRKNLNEYVKNLLTQPAHISQYKYLALFFAPQNQWDEMKKAPTRDGNPAAYSNGSLPSSNGTPYDDSQLRGDIDADGYPTGLSAAPAKQQYQNVQQQQYGSEPARETSSLSQPSNGSAQNLAGGGQEAPAIKVKIYYGDDLFAIRVSRAIEYPEFYNRIKDRLKISAQDEFTLAYKDERTGNRINLISNNDLFPAIDNNEKLVIYVDPA